MNGYNMKTELNWYKLWSRIFLCTTIVLYLMVFGKVKTPEKLLFDIWNIATNETFLSSLFGAGIAGGFSIYVLRKQSSQNEKMLEIQLQDSRNQFNKQYELERIKFNIEHQLNQLLRFENLLQVYQTRYFSIYKEVVDKAFVYYRVVEINGVDFITSNEQSVNTLKNILSDLDIALEEFAVFNKYFTVYFDIFEKNFLKEIVNDNGFGSYVKLLFFLSEFHHKVLKKEDPFKSTKFKELNSLSIDEFQSIYLKVEKNFRDILGEFIPKEFSSQTKKLAP